MIEQMNYVGKLVRFRNNTSQPKRVKHQQGSMLYLDGEFGPYHQSQVEIVEEPSVPGSNPGEDAHTSEAQTVSVLDHGQEERALAAGASADRRIHAIDKIAQSLKIDRDVLVKAMMDAEFEFTARVLATPSLETQVLERAMFGTSGLEPLMRLQQECVEYGRRRGYQHAAQIVEASASNLIGLDCSRAACNVLQKFMTGLAERIRSLQSPQPSEAENPKT